MKAVTVIFNVSIQEEVHAAIRKVGITAFTQWPRIVGQGPETGPRMDSHVWPGANAGLLMVVEDELADGWVRAIPVVVRVCVRINHASPRVLPKEGGWVDTRDAVGNTDIGQSIDSKDPSTESADAAANCD